MEGITLTGDDGRKVTFTIDQQVVAEEAIEAAASGHREEAMRIIREGKPYYLREPGREASDVEDALWAFLRDQCNKLDPGPAHAGYPNLQQEIRIHGYREGGETSYEGQLAVMVVRAAQRQLDKLHAE